MNSKIKRCYYKHKGQNLAELAIILSVVVVVVIFALTLLGGNIFTLFDKINAFNPFDMNQQAQEITLTNSSVPANSTETGSTVTVGPLGGTANNPVLQCTKSKCDLDLGDYLLTGIPENFGDLVKTTGASGGTDSLLSLINQIADQLEQKGDVDGAKEYRQLANLGHFIAEIQATNESTLVSCGTTGYAANLCFKDTRLQANNINLPPELVGILTGYSPATSLGTITDQTELGKTRNDLITNSPLFNTKTSPAAAFISTFDSILSNPKYSDQMKGITNELYLNIANLTADHRANGYKADYLLTQTQGEKFYTTTSAVNLKTPLRVYDPLTGAVKKESWYYSTGGVLDVILHPPTSVGTNLNSTLICATGWHKDTGSNCH